MYIDNEDSIDDFVLSQFGNVVIDVLLRLLIIIFICNYYNNAKL